jgi:flagellin
MSIVVNTNIGSLNAQRSLAESSRELSTAMERLSSGKKINSASDDAAGFAIAERMTAQIRGLNMATKNANDGLAMLSTIENATNDVTDMLQRIRELAVQASNDTNSSTDRIYLQREVDSLLNEINRVASQTVYNNKTVLDGTHTGQLQVGTENGQNITFNIKSIDTDTLGLTGLSSDAATEATNAATGGTPALVGAFTPDFKPAVIATTSDDNATYEADGTISTANQTALETAAASTTGGSDGILGLSVLTAADAEAALEKISVAIEQVGGNRAEYGSLANRLEYTVSNLMNVAEFTTSARSRIEDADFAAESARLAKAQVLQQTGTAMLAQANAASQLAIQLIR